MSNGRTCCGEQSELQHSFTTATQRKPWRADGTWETQGLSLGCSEAFWGPGAWSLMAGLDETVGLDDLTVFCNLNDSVRSLCGRGAGLGVKWVGSGGTHVGLKGCLGPGVERSTHRNTLSAALDRTLPRLNQQQEQLLP